MTRVYKPSGDLDWDVAAPWATVCLHVRAPSAAAAKREYIRWAEKLGRTAHASELEVFPRTNGGLA